MAVAIPMLLLILFGFALTLDVAFDVFTGTELAIFGEYWSYDEERADVDDFDVLRYGVALAWRLP